MSVFSVGLSPSKRAKSVEVMNARGHSLTTETHSAKEPPAGLFISLFTRESFPAGS